MTYVLFSTVRLRAWLWGALLAGLMVPVAEGQWLQFGGPNRDFSCDAAKLADRWPEGGPPRLWTGEIGHGHSTILVDGDRLYTMCRRGENEDAVLCYDAKTGKIVWETRYDAPTKEGMELDFGAGPHATPLVVGDRVFTIGAMVQFRCLDKQTGKILWSHDLMDEMKSSHMLRGYGASPIAYNDLVIINLCSPEAGVAAFRQDTGELAWKSEPMRSSYTSPILVRFNGQDQLVVALGGVRAGLDPATGKTVWKAQVPTQSFGIMTSPVWIQPDRLFFTASYGGGTRLFKIKTGEDGACVAEELWHYRKMQVAHGTVARIGEAVYGSSDGSFGPAFLMAIDLETGKPLWRERGFAKANLLHADGKLIILDETGLLALAKVDRNGLEVLSQTKVLEEKAWTAPTLVDGRLYLRDYHTIMALDLTAAAGATARSGEVRP